MTKKKLIIIDVLLILLLTVLLGWYLLQTQGYTYLYREQQQIFLQDWDYCKALLQQVGGLSTLIAQWLTQYFTTPLHGSYMTAVLSGLCATMLWLTMKRFKVTSPFVLPFAFAPLLMQNLCLVQTGYHYEGLVALTMMSVLLWGYSLVADRFKWYIRLIVGAFCTVILFYFAGSIATLFALSVLTYDALKRNNLFVADIVLLVIVGIMAFISVSNGSVVGYDYALWTKGYYEYFMPMGWMQHLAWISVILVLAAAWVSQFNHSKTYVQAAACLIVAAGCIYLYADKADNLKEKDFYTLMQLQNNINNEQWDEILSNPDVNTRNLLHLNCINLALSKKDMLLDRLFSYPQAGAQSLMADYQAYSDVNVLFSHIYYHMGIVSEALCLTFGTEIATTHGNPTLMKLLIKERLIFGDYDVAEKYISQLERTHSYAAWATQQRRFLYNDAAVEADPELGLKRRDLPAEGTEFVTVNGIMADLLKVIDTNPEEHHAVEYVLAMALLDKNMNAVKFLIEKYYGTKALPTLPDCLQQAVISYAEQDSDYCLQHGVSQEMLDQFATFRQRTLDLRHSNQNVQAGLASYRGTFWYYLMFQ